MNIHHYHISILFLYCILLNGISGQTIIDLEDGYCNCEEMLTDYECLLLQKCKFENGKCTSLSCSEMKSEPGCYLSSGCAWDKKEKKCDQFKSCSFYEFDFPSFCKEALPNCYYDSELKKCEDISKLPKCSEQLLSSCLHGREGLCVVKDGKCQEFTICEDVDVTDIRCQLTGLGCKYRNEEQCTSMMGGCKDAGWTTCSWAQETINGSRMYRCKQRAIFDFDCLDWDPLETTMETCLSESFFYYHWKDNKCQKCQSVKSDFLLELAIMLIMLTY